MKKTTFFLFVVILLTISCTPTMKCEAIGNIDLCLPEHGEFEKSENKLVFYENRDGLLVEIDLLINRVESDNQDDFINRLNIAPSEVVEETLDKVTFKIYKTQSVNKNLITTVRLETIQGYGFDGEYEYILKSKVVNFNKAEKYYNYIFKKL